MGRIGSPYKALELLLSEDASHAAALAKVLDTENRNRQKIEARILEEAVARVEREVNFKDHKVIVLSAEGWHPGVIGIVASRIADRFCRPALLISLDGKPAKGSGRSFGGFHLFDCVSKCKGLLNGFGGHESACGITIEKDMIDDFRIMVNEQAAGYVDADTFKRNLDVDMEIPLSLLTEDVIGEIEGLSPFGAENPTPVLASCKLTVKETPRRIGKNGFKMWVTDNMVTCEAVSFGKSRMTAPEAGSEIDIAYVPSVNSWQGLNSIQLELRDIREG
jgi:single-stranded-DNA-specific exonuclease